MKQSYSVLGGYVAPDGGLVNASIPRILAKTKGTEPPQDLAGKLLTGYQKHTPHKTS